MTLTLMTIPRPSPTLYAALSFPCVAWFHICPAADIMSSVSRWVFFSPPGLASTFPVSGLDCWLVCCFLPSCQCGPQLCGLIGRSRLRMQERGLGGMAKRVHKDRRSAQKSFVDTLMKETSHNPPNEKYKHLSKQSPLGRSNLQCSFGARLSGIP